LEYCHCRSPGTRASTKRPALGLASAPVLADDACRVPVTIRISLAKAMLKRSRGCTLGHDRTSFGNIFPGATH
jgi:hypothetical protein